MASSFASVSTYPWPLFLECKTLPDSMRTTSKHPDIPGIASPVISSWLGKVFSKFDFTLSNLGLYPHPPLKMITNALQLGTLFLQVDVLIKKIHFYIINAFSVEMGLGYNFYTGLFQIHTNTKSWSSASSWISCLRVATNTNTHLRLHVLRLQRTLI